MTPKRIQRSRAKGWRKPEGAIIVTRPGRWGNPFSVAQCGSSEAAVAMFRRYLNLNPQLAKQAREELAGRDLLCWCKPGEPCHADVLIEVANGGTQQ
jgi:hypothetical protein